MERWTERTRLLLGDEKLGRLRSAHVLVVGLGGVGAYAAEMIVRAGAGRLTIADADRLAAALAVLIAVVLAACSPKGAAGGDAACGLSDDDFRTEGILQAIPVRATFLDEVSR